MDECKKNVVGVWYYSNCLIMALIIRCRLGGRLVMIASAYSVVPHFMVQKNGRYIDFTCRNHDEPKYRQIWFEGRLRRRKVGWYKKSVVSLL